MSYQCPTCGTMRSCWESGAVISSMTPHQDGGEQRAFESWAEGVGLPMEQHPLHYLFLDPVTHAARQAWKAALEHAALTEAKQQGPGEAVAALMPLWRKRFGITDAYKICADELEEAIAKDTPQVEAKRQTGEGANASVNGREPTHYCTQCGALWLSGEDYWSLVSLHCGKCCDNQPMTADLIKPLLRWREWPGMGHVLVGEQ